MPRKRIKKEPFWEQLNANLKPFQREIAGLLVLALAAITILGLFSVTSGVLSNWWIRLLRRVFGLGAYVVAAGLVVAGISLLLSNLGQKLKAGWRIIIGLEIIFVAGLALIHLLSFSQDPLRLAESGEGGGLVGWAISNLLIGALGWPIALLIFLAILSLGIALAFDLSRISVQIGTGAAIARVLSLYERLIPPTMSAPPPVEEYEEPPAEVIIKGPEAPVAATVQQPEVKTKKERKSPAPRRRKASLPPLDLLDQFTTQAFSQEGARRRARVIEETLASFGVPARVVEISHGPVVTQFGVEPGYIESTGADGSIRRRKIRISKITSLADDLALALAASPIRIEAPVPGRSIVGIEVPNSEISLVSLRGVMKSKEFRRLDSRLKIALGEGVAGQPVAADLATMPHLLISGATGSGKSVCINAIITCLVFNNSPEDLRLVLVDPKRVELSRFKGLPHLLSGVEHEAERVIGVLKWVIREMEERYKKFAEAGSRNLEDYNRQVKPRRERLPYIVVIIDELADLMLFAPDEIEWLVCRIAQMARATGIHLVIATQRPSVDVVTGLIKANFPARISFAVTSQVDSRVILDSVGAESLLGAGDMLYMASDSSKLVRIQGCFVSDEEIKRVVEFWQAKAESDWLEAQPPWEELMKEDKVDELLGEAIELVKKHNRASTSFLQRKLRIGYPRASRIIDQLEERGIISPLKDNGRSREVLISTTDELTTEDLEEVD
ncbi:MAG: DNA translocase FtsK 4TM domain-containing protein [Anaerolineae bacterium]|nr:DNA translocase FtsK 4TM domain-containing protein [Anaerolineae bacterium]